MIRAAIICPDQELATLFQGVLTAFPNIRILKVSHQFPNEANLSDFFKASEPELIFLSAENPGEAADVAVRIAAASAGTAVVAIGRTCFGPTMLQLLRAGAKDFVALPFEAGTMQAMLQRAEALLSSRREVAQQNASIFAFLPAKAGAGSTTIAVNTSLALARTPGAKPLLIDLDLTSGLVGFMMSVTPPYSVIEAAENASDMDETIWSKIVTSIGNLDLLPAEPAKHEAGIETSQIRQILDFAQRQYSTVCIDMSGMLEKYSIDALYQAKEIFLVCTPEVPSLHLARVRLDLLRNLDLDERVSLLVNRVENSHRTIPVEEIEKLLKRTIAFTLPNAFDATREAGISGKPVKATTELGMGFAKLAQRLFPTAPPEPERRRSFLDVFARQRSVLAKS